MVGSWTPNSAYSFRHSDGLLPHGPEEAAELEITQKIGNLSSVQGGSRQIVLCKKLACMVELLLERRAFV